MTNPISFLISLCFLFPLFFNAAILHGLGLNSVSAACELSYRDRNKIYNYSLASPLSKFPHGILSEDGFYKVAANGTVVWFQLCDTMLFNHDPPSCVDCRACGGPSHCGMGCSALAANYVGGYPVCDTLGHPSTTVVHLIDAKEPYKGVIVKMSSSQPKANCSLVVSVICDSRVNGPLTLHRVGTCDYSTELRHPAGCANIISSGGKGWGWFGIFIIIVVCLLGAYLLAGAVYRYFFLNIRGIDVIPNLEFWASLPHKIQHLFMSIVRRFRGPSEGYRSSYSPVNF